MTHDNRDAGTGRYVTDEYADAHPDTTVRETRTDRQVEEALTPDDLVKVGRLFTAPTMLDPVHGYVECYRCGASLILSTSTMNYGTARHYLWHEGRA